MTSFLTREGPRHSDILFWTCDWCFHLLFLSHHCLKGRNCFSHFSDGETETQKCQEDAMTYLRGWLSPIGLSITLAHEFQIHFPLYTRVAARKSPDFLIPPQARCTSVHLSGLNFLISVPHEGAGRGHFEAGLTWSYLLDSSLSNKTRRCPRGDAVGLFQWLPEGQCCLSVCHVCLIILTLLSLTASFLPPSPPPLSPPCCRLTIACLDH